jgi:hypothetical protein
MKYVFTIFAAAIIITTAYPQYEVRAGMGINFGSTPSLKDYINQIAGSQELGSFISSIIFSGEFDYAASPTYDMGFELGYLLNSVTFNTFGTYDFTYHIIMPTVTSYYVIRGNGYNFKFGGGVGLRLVSADETIPASPSAINYTSIGPGFLLRIAGNTRLSDNVYAYIAGDLRYDLNGDLKGWTAHHNTEFNQVNLNTFSAGVGLGVTYAF